MTLPTIIKDHIVSLGVEKDRITADIKKLQESLADIDSAITALEQLSPASPLMFYISSRTKPTTKAGHFIEYFKPQKNTTCSCEAGRYGSDCWAARYIRKNMENGDNSFLYTGTRSHFYSRVRPGNITVLPKNSWSLT